MSELTVKFGADIQNSIDSDNKKLAKQLLKNISNFIKTKKICVEFSDTQE